MSGSSKQTFLQRRHTSGQEVHEMMFNITNYYINSNKKYNEVSPHTSQNSHSQKYLKKILINAGKTIEQRGSPSKLFLGMC